MKPKESSCSYLQYCLQRKYFLAHRVVALTWIPNPGGKPEVNHKDGDKSNNHPSNLEWVSSSENKKHAYECGLMSSTRKRDGKKVKMIKDNGEILIFNSAKECAKKLGISYTNLTLVLTGKRANHRVKKLKASFYYL